LQNGNIWQKSTAFGSKSFAALPKIRQLLAQSGLGSFQSLCIAHAISPNPEIHKSGSFLHLRCRALPPRIGAGNVKKARLSKFKCAAALNVVAMFGAGVAATAILATAAQAQDYSNVTASGRVIGTDGNPISGAEVTYVSNDQGFTRTTTTDSSGGFRLSQLPTGSYSVTIKASGYEDFSDSAVIISPDRAANQFALASVGGAAEIVVTAGRVQVVDFERTTTGAVIEVAEVAARVPVARDLTAVVKLSPGTTQGDAAFGNLPNIGGASVAENQYYINGLNLTDFRKGLGATTVPFEFYETVEVKNGGFQAEFGRTTGGVVNATTKSGSNTFHGGVLVTYEPNSLQATGRDFINPRTSLPLVNNSADYRQRIDANFFLSGPIIKDRLFFYALYNPRNVEFGDGIATSGRFDRAKTTSPFYGGKIDAEPIDGQRFELTYFNTEGQTVTNSFAFDPTTNAIGAGQSSETVKTGGENYVGRYTGTFTDWLTISAAYGKNKNREITGSSRNDFPTIIDNRSGTPQNIGNPTTVVETALDTREFYRGDIDLRFDLFGSHHIRAGYDQENLTTFNTSSYTGDVVYQYFIAGAGDTFAPVGTQYVSARTFINGGQFKSINKAFYIQDNWTLFDNRLNLQFGIRNDRFENRNVEGETFYKSGDQWGPRFGFSGDPFGDGKTKVYGSFGRYFLPIASNTNVRLAGAEFDLTRYNVLTGVNSDNTPIIGAPLLFAGADACFDTGVRNCENISDGAATPTEATVAKNLKPQSMDEYILGVEQRLGGGWRVGLYGTYRKLNRALEDVAIDAAVNAYCAAEGIDCNTASGSPIWSGFHQYVLVNPGQPSTITLSNPVNGESSLRTIEFSADDLGYPSAVRKYKALTATFEREWDGKWSVAGSYTWSKLRGNYEGAVKSDNGQDDAGITTDFDQPGLTNGSFGFLPNDRRHNFKLYGAYQVTDWFLFGANVSVTSPRKYGCLGRIPRTIDAFAALYGSNSWYCHLDAQGEVITTGTVLNPQGVAGNPNPAAQLTPRGSQFSSPWQKQLDLTFAFTLPTELFNGTFRVDVFNVFNTRSALDFEERGTLGNGQPRNTYALPNSFQRPRYVRLQFGVQF
jgi:hypothetical protein